MKKNNLNTILLCILVLISFNAKSQINTKGSIIINPYYGFPNFGDFYYFKIEGYNSDSNYKSIGIGPAGLRAEYMLNDQCGIGFDFIYNSSEIKHMISKTTYIYDTVTKTNLYTTTSIEKTRLMRRIRFQAKFNYHFEISNPNLDFYFGIGIGTNMRRIQYYENNIEVQDKYYDEFDDLIMVPLPISSRICFGFGYAFSPKIGINCELGLGGPILSAGVKLKLM